MSKFNSSYQNSCLAFKTEGCKTEHSDSGMNNSFFHSSQPRNQVWILVIQNWPI